MDDVTLGELARRMDSMHADVRDLRSSIVDHNDLSAVKVALSSALTAHEARTQLQLDQVNAKVASLESWNTWAVRIVLGLVLTAVLGLVLLPA